MGIEVPFDYYSVLGVDRRATLDDLRAAYRQLAKTYHPDVGFVSDEQIKLINETYGCLSNPDRRRTYDAAWNPPVDPLNAVMNDADFSNADQPMEQDSSASSAPGGEGPRDDRAWSRQSGYESPFAKLRRVWVAMSIGREAMHDELKKLSNTLMIAGFSLAAYLLLIRGQSPWAFLISGFGIFPVIVIQLSLLVVGMTCGFVASLLTPKTVPLRHRCNAAATWAVFSFGPAMLIAPFTSPSLSRVLLFVVVSCIVGSLITVAYCLVNRKNSTSGLTSQGLYLSLICISLLGGMRAYSGLAADRASGTTSQAKASPISLPVEQQIPKYRPAGLDSRQLGLSSQVVAVTWSAWRPNKPGLLYGSNPTPDATFNGMGSSGVYQESGGKLYVFTNQHVLGLQQIASAREQSELAIKVFDVSVVFPTGKRKTALRVLHQVNGPDLAAIELDASGLVAGVDYVVLPPIDEMHEINAGDETVAVGNPRGLIGTRTFGHVSSLRTDQLANGGQVELVQTDASLNPGNSGGPLFVKMADKYLWAGSTHSLFRRAADLKGRISRYT